MTNPLGRSEKKARPKVGWANLKGDKTMSQNLNHSCSCDREGYNEWADPLGSSELNPDQAKPGQTKPDWSECPICGDQVLRKSPTQVCCGAPKCYYQLEKWRKLGAKIYRANEGWVDQLVKAWRKGEKG